MKVILRETISNLGIIGTEVTVKDGYARNYLLPQGKALIANEKNRNYFEQAKTKIALKIEKEKAFAEDLQKKLEAISITVKAKLKDIEDNEKKEIYGSVGVRDIIDELKAQNVEVEKKDIILPAPIKNIGEYKVPIFLYQNVEAKITVNVVTE